MTVEVYRVSQIWQLADVYTIRRQTKIHGSIPAKQIEFDEVWDQPYHYLLIEQDGQPVGTCRLNFTHTDFAKIERVSVIDGYQGQGFGRLLIEKAEQWSQERGYHQVVITSLDTAIGFYQKLGYVPQGGAVVQDDGVSTIYTEKQLLPAEV
ncbi:GNAT family N-acetyltransferase [Secundilactobacillus kimchicus]|uniref:N-acetyltransferase domain-containing protein n=1 Tax=Secundilactobacillus kimchicus JCM 15530 TaxID=1302272 RepID=A0A0R1HU25_9LACO|nr:GNAT family N-acetyltransferase [Secundilactobacillus kimchicus]KRK47284.1 hypothetical protein FC96_GL000554 [Secundilactobacillus kimchicus JCM 15530]